MNRNKEMMIRFCILCGICGATLGINTALHNKNYNGIKISQENKVEIKQLDNYEKFMNLVSDSRIELEATKKKQEQAEQTRQLKVKQNERKNVSLSRGAFVEYDMTFELTFYSGLNIENSKYGAVGCRGVKLFDGVVASNVIPYGTKIKLQGWGNVEVLDSGGSNFDAPHRLDVYVPRIDGENDREYYKRVQKMGRVKVQGKIIK
jgi:3D (Asp-Asp-Asp) domain-containing protein